MWQDDLPFSLTSFFPHQRASLLTSKSVSTKDTSMADFITTVKNSQKWDRKSKEAIILKKAILFVQKIPDKGNICSLTRAFFDRMKKKPHLYQLDHLCTTCRFLSRISCGRLAGAAAAVSADGTARAAGAVAGAVAATLPLADHCRAPFRT
jgi:hypothetical protein